MTASISPDNPPYLTLTISQALSLPAPASLEPTQHETVNMMLDSRAREKPDHLATGFTYLTPEGAWQCHTLTYAQIRSLSISLAAELKAKLPGSEANPKSPNSTPLVAVLSPSGIDLFAHIVALWRLGYGVLCIAPGSPAESIANLLRLTETKVILAHASQFKAAQAAIEAAATEGNGKAITAEAEEMLPHVTKYISSNQSNGHTNPEQTSPDSASSADVLVTMHTSGSSGLPKPIYQLHRFWTTSMLSAPGRELSAFTTTPLFHGGMSDLLRSIQAGSTIYFHPTADPGALSTQAICSAITACKQPISYFLSVPYILNMLFTDRADRGRKMLASMELVSTGGAPLPQQLGDDMVQEGVKLVSRLGSSECGFLMSSWRDFGNDNEWNQLRLPDKLGQEWIRFQPHDPNSSSRLYELVVTKDWPTKLVANRGDGSYATSDLYAKHESLPNTWRYDSRSDDTIVLVSGKKVSSPLAESKLKASPMVSEAILFGANRAILGALVFITQEAAPEGTPFDAAAKVKVLEQLQPVLAEIKAASPPHAQLATEMLCLLPPSEAARIPRASKGTLQRGRAYQHYADLIDSVYSDFEEGRSLRLEHANGSGAKDGLKGEELIAWLRGKVESINGASLSPDIDLFVAGVDSIQSARIRAAIHQSIELGGRLLERNVVYEYPTMRLLAKHVEEARTGSDGSRTKDEKQQREIKLMQELMEKYAKPQSQAATRKQNGANAAAGTLYVLTGVTGGLGAQVLDQVLTQSQPKDVIVCLVRVKAEHHARQRVLDSLSSRQLDQALSSVESRHGRVYCLPADLSRADCGLADGTLSKLAHHEKVVTVHSAWSVNFVAGLCSFEAENIAGLAHLIDLHQALASHSKDPRASCFTFCSSVASILGQRSTDGGLGERLSTDPEDAVAMGYARSKWVAEQIVSRRAQNSQSRSNIIRLGQLCSDTRHGVWNESEAWPILIQISQKIGCFPDLPNERLDWLSADVAARAVLDLSRSPEEAGKEGEEEVEVYNLAQPTTRSQEKVASWKDLHSWLQSSGLPFELVRPTEWLDRVQKSDVDHRGLLSLWQKNFSAAPATDSPTRFVCDKALATSDAFRTWQTEAVTESLVNKTVQRWKTIGFLK